MPDFAIEILTSDEILNSIEQIARLRIDIFREFPYLYDGDLDYEAGYLKKFTTAPDSIIVALKVGDLLAGAMTGLPLANEDAGVTAPWRDQGLSLAKVYYFSEILLYPVYRGRGLGRKTFQAGEDWVEAMGGYEQWSLATVIRQKDHPSRPKDYVDTDGFWQKMGYTRQESLICHIAWKELGDSEEKENPLVFWTKQSGSTQ